MLFVVVSGPSWAQGETMSRDELNRLIDERVEQRLRSNTYLQDRIREGIETYVREQREAAASRQRQQDATLAKGVKPYRPDIDHLYGSPDAEITLIEFSDFECPFCKRFHPTARQLVDQSKGTINWVYRHFPLSFHNPGAQKQAEASECAAVQGGDESFWRYTDAIYERTTSNGNGFPIARLVPLAGELGLNVGQFRECLDSGSMADRVNADFEEGQAVGITGTPGNILLNNRTGDAALVSGAQPLSVLQRAAESMANR